MKPINKAIRGLKQFEKDLKSGADIKNKYKITSIRMKKGIISRISNRGTFPTGFTIIEFITIIAIFAMLIGILIPALNMAKQKAKEQRLREADQNIEILDKEISLNDFFIALGSVESNNQNDAIGDDGRSIGRYQISEAYWQDSNVPGQYDDCYNPEYSERVMVAYWMRYCPNDFKNQNWEVLARIHNGGPRGIEKDSTEYYWQKVKAILYSN